MKTLYITDLDGTLLNTKDGISPYSLSTLNRLVQEGVPFTYATARSLISARSVTEGLHLTLPVIGYNGCFIFDPNNGSILSSTYFEDDEIQFIKSILERYHISPIVYSFINNVEKVSWFNQSLHYGTKRYLDKRKGDPRLNPLNSQQQLYDGNLFYFTCIGEKEDLYPVYQELKQDKRFHCIFQQELYRPEYWCEIMPVKGTKANAVLKLKQMLKCDRVVAFGDSKNDIEMFRVSDECYAVENAIESLKSISTGIIESNDHDGVANWLIKDCSK